MMQYSGSGVQMHLCGMRSTVSITGAFSKKRFSPGSKSKWVPATGSGGERNTVFWLLVEDLSSRFLTKRQRSLQTAASTLRNLMNSTHSWIACVPAQSLTCSHAASGMVGSPGGRKPIHKDGP